MWVCQTDRRKKKHVAMNHHHYALLGFSLNYDVKKSWLDLSNWLMKCLLRKTFDAAEDRLQIRPPVCLALHCITRPRNYYFPATKICKILSPTRLVWEFVRSVRQDSTNSASFQLTFTRHSITKGSNIEAQAQIVMKRWNYHIFCIFFFLSFIYLFL